MRREAPPIPGDIIGGYEILGEGPRTFNGIARYRVRCTNCEATCVRELAAIRINKLGCIRCKNKTYRSQRGARIGAAVSKKRAMAKRSSVETCATIREEQK